MDKALQKINDLLQTLDDSINESKTNKNEEKIPDAVLTIQSTVVFGICGNKSALFPLQLFGYNACPLNTVQFSNHTGYPKWRGKTTTGNELLELINGLEDNNLYDFEYVITGYMGSTSCINELSNILIKLKNNLLKNNNKSLFYVCDPAMGDNGKLYSEHFKPFLEIYKKNIIQHCTLFLPNSTEASLILDMEYITNPTNAFIACMKLHKLGIKYVVITSIEDPNNKNIIHVIYSDISWNNKKYGYLKIPKIDGYWVGTGDLCTSLIFIWFNKTKNLKIAVENTMTTMQLIIKRTKQLKSKELIINGKQAMNDILNPSNIIKSQFVNIIDL